MLRDMQKSHFLFILVCVVLFCAVFPSSKGIANDAGGIAKQVTLFVGSKGYIQDGMSMTAEAAPFHKEGITFVPVSTLAGAYGMEEQFVYYREDRNIYITPDSNIIKIDVGGIIDIIEIDIDITNYKEQGYLALPFRFIAEMYGLAVEWGPKYGPGGMGIIFK